MLAVSEVDLSGTDGLAEVTPTGSPSTPPGSVADEGALGLAEKTKNCG